MSVIAEVVNGKDFFFVSSAPKILSRLDHDNIFVTYTVLLHTHSNVWITPSTSPSVPMHIESFLCHFLSPSLDPRLDNDWYLLQLYDEEAQIFSRHNLLIFFYLLLDFWGKCFFKTKWKADFDPTSRSYAVSSSIQGKSGLNLYILHVTQKGSFWWVMCKKFTLQCY